MSPPPPRRNLNNDVNIKRRFLQCGPSVLMTSVWHRTRCGGADCRPRAPVLPDLCGTTVRSRSASRRQSGKVPHLGFTRHWLGLFGTEPTHDEQFRATPWREIVRSAEVRFLVTSYRHPRFFVCWLDVLHCRLQPTAWMWGEGLRLRPRWGWIPLSPGEGESLSGVGTHANQPGRWAVIKTCHAHF